MSRRNFIAQTGSAVLAAGMAASPAGAAEESAPPSERLGVGFMGLRNQGRLNMLGFLETGEADVAALCDVDENVIDSVAAECSKHPNNKRPPRHYTDFRRMLEDPDVDAVCISTPDHWHAIALIMACEAGKDVYVEKPLSWCIAEGRAMVNAARKHRRIVQVGNYQRSGQHFFDAVELLRSGRLGAIPLAKAWITHLRADIGNPPDGPVPERVDYDLWLGPAPERPFNPNRFHYNWHWYWDYGTGEMGNWGAHWLDVVRWGLDLDVPLAACASGGRFQRSDSHETPDTQMVLFDYPSRTILWEQWLWSRRYNESMSQGAAFYGSKGTLLINRGGWTLIGEDGKTVEEKGEGSELHVVNIRNFIDCVRTRKMPNSDVEEGHKTAILCHLANISIRTGRKLNFDAASETVRNDPEANAFLSREYRKPWTLNV